MSFYYLSIYLPCNILLQQFNQRKRTTAIQLVLENKELLRLFCSSCKSMQRKGQSCQLFHFEVFCGSSTVHRRHSHHLSIGKIRSPQCITQLCFQHWTPPSATMRAYLNEKCLPTLPQLNLLRNNRQKGFLRGGRSSDPLPGIWAEKWNLGPNPVVRECIYQRCCTPLMARIDLLASASCLSPVHAFTPVRNTESNNST